MCHVKYDGKKQDQTPIMSVNVNGPDTLKEKDSNWIIRKIQVYAM